MGPAKALALLSLLVTSSLASPTNSNSRKTVTVKAGTSIQAAINAACEGTKIIVEAGTYNEQILIQKDRIELIGKPGAIIAPPTGGPTTNPCSGLALDNFDLTRITQAGICIAGKGVQYEAPVKEHLEVKNVGSFVTGVSVTGFVVQDFDGLNIAIVRAKDTNVFKNRLVNGILYGALTVGSKDTRIFENLVEAPDVTKPHIIAICNDDKSDVSVTKNTIIGYLIGLCVQTDKADVSRNTVSFSCIGAFVDPDVKGARVKDNSISSPITVCADIGFPLGAVGIVLSGADQTDVKRNTIAGQNYGIALTDFTDPPPVKTSDRNTITDNTVSDSTTADFYVDTTGKGNVIKRNKCKGPSPYCS